MRRILTALTLLALLGGAAQAQQWIGLRSGYPLGVTLHYGTALETFDLRVSGRLVAGGDRVRLGVGVDALRTVLRDGPVVGYIGAGPAIELGDDTLVLDVRALAGGEFRFSAFDLDALGVFLEGSLGARFGVTSGTAEFPAVGAALGVNWRF
jgi:hypothetical protein